MQPSSHAPQKPKLFSSFRKLIIYTPVISMALSGPEYRYYEYSTTTNMHNPHPSFFLPAHINGPRARFHQFPSSLINSHLI
jgi:hypothetical protein